MRPLTFSVAALPETIDYPVDWTSPVHGGRHRRWTAWNQHAARSVPGRALDCSAVCRIPPDLVDLLQIGHEGQET